MVYFADFFSVSSKIFNFLFHNYVYFRKLKCSPVLIQVAKHQRVIDQANLNGVRQKIRNNFYIICESIFSITPLSYDQCDKYWLVIDGKCPYRFGCREIWFCMIVWDRQIGSENSGKISTTHICAMVKK